MSPTASSPTGVRTGLIVRDSGDAIPLDHVHVEAQVSDLTARVTVRQTYRNREDKPVEVVYVHPVEEGAAVCGFDAVVDGVRFVGTVMERDEAFRTYDDAMEAGDGAYLLDEERADVFTASLGNVKPGSEIVLSITYVTELAAEGQAGRFTLPTTVSPRYAPAEDAAGVGPTPNDVLNPTFALDVPYAFTFEMSVAMDGHIRSVTSPSHPIEVEHDGTTARVRLAQRSAPMDRDLVVVIAADGLDVPHAVVERGEQGGAVMVSIVPRFESGEQPADVVFVIDRSGSMDGTSIEEVRNALQLCLRSLTPGCRFNIVSFGDRHSALFPESRPYDDASMREAARFVSTLQADMGGTEMLPALESVLARPAAPGLPRQVLLLTDGEVTNTDAVIALARRHAATRALLHFRDRRRRQPAPGSRDCAGERRRGRVHRTRRADRGEGDAPVQAGARARADRRHGGLGPGREAGVRPGAAGVRRRAADPLRDDGRAEGWRGHAEGGAGWEAGAISTSRWTRPGR